MHPCGHRRHVFVKKRLWQHVARTAALCVFFEVMSLSTATVVVYDQNATRAGRVETRFDDIPAVEDFGPRVPDQVTTGNKRKEH